MLQRLHYRIEIDAPVARVWDTMFDDATYRDWTAAFMPGSHYVGDWNEGRRIAFLAPGEKGPGGLISRVRESRRHEFVGLEHVGFVQDGREETSPERVGEWAGAREEYTFRDLDAGRTELLVELDSDGANVAMFDAAWPKALQRLKELAESQPAKPEAAGESAYERRQALRRFS